MKQQTESLPFSFSLCSGEKKRERERGREGWLKGGGGGILSFAPYR